MARSESKHSPWPLSATLGMCRIFIQTSYLADLGKLKPFPGGAQFSSVQFSHSVVSDSVTPWIAADQASLSITNSQNLLKIMSIESVMPSNHLSLVILFSSCLQSFPASGFFPVSQFFTSGGQSIGVSASISVLPMNIQDWFPLEWTAWVSCSPRDSQESSPTPRFKSINSSMPSLLCSPTLTSIHDHWKNHSFD